MSAAFLSAGFRPFFLAAGLWAAGGMALWIGMLWGGVALPVAFDPVSWHAHEALFGYLGAVMAGFLLTALPGWTRRPPLTGWPLAGLLALWVVGRVAMAVSAWLEPLWVALADLAAPVALAGYLLREIVAGRNWRNLVVVALVAVLVAGNAGFHREAATGAFAASGAGLRLGLAAAVGMISLIGGRIVPAFTRNWLRSRGSALRPAPFGPVDALALALTLLALAGWVAAPAAAATGWLLLAAGLAQAVRLARWGARATGSEALVWVLHAGYAFVPLGLVGVGAAILWPAAVPAGAAQHLWMAGAVGVMTLAVMTRATLGHGGRPLTAGPGTGMLFLAVIAAALTRVAAGWLPGQAMALWTLSAGLWCLGFAGFVLLHGRLLTGSGR